MISLGMEVHTFNPSTQEAALGRSLYTPDTPGLRCLGAGRDGWREEDRKIHQQARKMSALELKGNTLEKCNPGQLICRCVFSFSLLVCLGNANTGKRSDSAR